MKKQGKNKKSIYNDRTYFVIVIIGILTVIAIPRYFAVGQHAHQAVLISFVRILNRTTGENLCSKSISEGKNGSIVNLASNEDAAFLSKYVQIPKEINASDINLSKCGNGVYKTVMTANPDIAGEEYNITCKDGTATTAPYFRLIRIKDNKTLVSRD